MPASAPKARIEQFFRRYQRRFQRALDDLHDIDTDAVTGAFADYFVQSSLAGVYGGKNGLKFKFLIGRGFARYRKIGITSMAIAKIESTPLDPTHALAKVNWDSRYRARARTAPKCGSCSPTSTSCSCGRASRKSSVMSPATKRRC